MTARPDAASIRGSSAPSKPMLASIAWTIERARARPEPGPFRLEWVIGPAGIRTRLVLSRGKTIQLASESMHARWVIDRMLGLAHLDVGSGPDVGSGQERVLSVTADISEDRPRLLYARTAQLSRLAVPGGCAEIAMFEMEYDR